jgi:hypothetical protein
MKFLRGLGLVGVATVAASCGATTLYQGPVRPESESAVVESVDTVIDEIDGQNVQRIRSSKSRYVLQPGPHVIGFSFLHWAP